MFRRSRWIKARWSVIECKKYNCNISTFCWFYCVNCLLKLEHDIFQEALEHSTRGPRDNRTAASHRGPYTEHHRKDRMMLRIYCVKETRQTAPLHKWVLSLTDENVFDLDTIYCVKEPSQTAPLHKWALFLTDENIFDLDTIYCVKEPSQTAPLHKWVLFLTDENFLTLTRSLGSLFNRVPVKNISPCDCICTLFWSPYVRCSVYEKPKGHCICSSNGTEHKRKYYYAQCTRHNCTSAKYTFNRNKLVTGHKNVMI